MDKSKSESSDEIMTDYLSPSSSLSGKDNKAKPKLESSDEFVKDHPSPSSSLSGKDNKAKQKLESSDEFVKDHPSPLSSLSCNNEDKPDPEIHDEINLNNSEHSENENDNFSAKTKASFKIVFSHFEWSKFQITTSLRGQRRFVGNWTDEINTKIKEVNPHCPLIFKVNRIKKKDSRKSNTPFFIGRAICKFDNCIEYTLKIKKEPKPNKSVKIKVKTIKGLSNINHTKDLRGRPIARENRTRVTKETVTSGPSNTYYNLLGAEKDSVIQAANKSNFGTKDVIRKIASESNVSERLHKDAFLEVAIQKEIFDKIDEAKHVKGRIQTLSLYPFTVHIYSEKQLEILHRHCLSGSGVLYFDATGEVIAKLPDHPKRVYYYPLVVKPKDGPPLPVAEMISNSHTTADIASFFIKINRDKTYLHANSPKPNRIEIDFSWAFIHSILLSWNKESLQEYLNRSYSCLNQNTEWGDKTKIHICSAHILHKVSTTVSKMCKDKILKQFILFTVGIMINSSSLEELDSAFTTLAILLMCKSEVDHPKYTESKATLEKRIINIDEPSYPEPKLPTADSENEGMGPKPCNSLFSIRYNFIYENIKAELTLSEDITNMYYCPDVINYLVKFYLTIAPLWTGLLLENSRDTNSPSEGWMKIVKHDILRGKKGLRPGKFIMAMYETMQGRIREYEMVKPSRKSKKDTPETKFDNEEVWGPKKPKQKKGYFTSPGKVPEPKLRRKVPGQASLHWGGQVIIDNTLVYLSNTCPVDNLLVLIHELLKIREIRTWFNSVDFLDVCQTILEIDSQFKAKKWTEGRNLWLTKYCGKPEGQKWDVWGSETERFVKYFAVIQEHEITDVCSKRKCLMKSKEVTRNEILLGCDIDIDEDETDRQTMSLQDYIDKWQTGKQSTCRFGPENQKCSGTRMRVSVEFQYCPPVLILSATCISQMYGFKWKDIPESVNVLGKRYNVFGYTICRGGHFVCYFNRANLWYQYNGLDSPEIRRAPDRTTRRSGMVEHVILFSVST